MHFKNNYSNISFVYSIQFGSINPVKNNFKVGEAEIFNENCVFSKANTIIIVKTNFQYAISIIRNLFISHQQI